MFERGSKTKFSDYIRTALPAFALLFAAAAGSCGGRRAELRSMVPSDTIIYIETADLGRMLETVAGHRGFDRSRTGAPDFSILSGVRVAVAVTGFETSENRVTDDRSILNFKPRFAAIAETNAWRWQLESLVRRSLDGFIKGIYGPGTKLEVSEREFGKWFLWTARDGRKAFAVIYESLILFGNDEDSLRKTLAAVQGKEESLAANSRISAQYPDAEETLGFGFVTDEGVKQLADFAGISLALERSDDGTKSLVSAILPKVVANTAEEIVWTAKANGGEIEDDLVIRLKPRAAAVFSETLAPENSRDGGLFRFVPAKALTVTRYNLRNPRIAFRSLLLVAGSGLDPRSAAFLPVIWNSVLAPYGIADAEGFLDAVDSHIVTAQLDEAGDAGIAIVRTSEFGKLSRYIDPDIDLRSSPARKGNALFWVSPDNDVSVARIGDYVVLGDAGSVQMAIEAGQRRRDRPNSIPNDLTNAEEFAKLRRPENVAVTISTDRESVPKIARALGLKLKDPSDKAYLATTETKILNNGIHRRYTSAFGFIGTLLEQFDRGQ